MDLTDLRDTPPWEWPGDAGRQIRKLLNNRNADPAERLIAAEFAGGLTVLDNDLANVLLAAIRSNEEPEDLRAEAAIAFGPVLEMGFIELDEESGEFDDPDALPISQGQFHTIRDALRRVYDDSAAPKLVRRKVLEASVRAQEKWQQEAIRTAYGSGDSEWMLTAVFAMQYIPGFENETLEALNSTDPKIQFEAVVAAGEQELDAAWPHLLSLAQNDGTEKNLRIAAIQAIGSMRPEEAEELLTELAHSDNEDIAAAADEALSTDDLFEDEEDDEDDEEDDEDEDEDDDEDEDEKHRPA